MMIVLRLACRFILVVVLAGIAAKPAEAADAAVDIKHALNQWIADFNAGRADKVCALFVPDLRADVRGQPERGYDGLCDLLKGSLADKENRPLHGLRAVDGGWGGIRTLETLARLPVFKTGAFNHSATHPISTATRWSPRTLST
jgi:hypothetical protein